MERQTVTLFELNKSLQLEIQQAFPSSYWLIAEIAEIKTNSSGHCYLELVEKQEINNLITSKARATIWAQRYRILSAFFYSSTGHHLDQGMKVLLNVTVEFHEIYGLSLNVLDIDPTYTVGDIEQQRQLTINRLQEEGVFDMNQSLEMPTVTQRIAIISSKTAAGYLDFIHQLETNKYGIKFYHKLFSALMQGSDSEGSIIQALENIFNNVDFFDVVVIIRGGGAKADLFCFDGYEISSHIAQYPLPVITGIGHEKDESVTDLVAYKNLKTPTAVAEYLIFRAAQFMSELEEFERELLSITEDILINEKQKLELLQIQFAHEVENKLKISKEKLNNYVFSFQNRVNKFKHQKEKTLLKTEYSLESFARLYMSIQNNNIFSLTNSLRFFSNQLLHVSDTKLTNYIENIKLVNPQNVLKRGYSISKIDGVLLKDLKEIIPGDKLTTQFYNGKIESEVKINKNDKKTD